MRKIRRSIQYRQSHDTSCPHLGLDLQEPPPGALWEDLDGIGFQTILERLGLWDGGEIFSGGSVVSDEREGRYLRISW